MPKYFRFFSFGSVSVFQQTETVSVFRFRFGFRPSGRKFSVSVRFSVIKMKNFCRICTPDRAPGTSPGEDRWMTLEEFVDNEEKRKKLYDYEELDQVLRPDWRSFYNF
jgi:hypothetical protein